MPSCSNLRPLPLGSAAALLLGLALASGSCASASAPAAAESPAEAPAPAEASESGPLVTPPVAASSLQAPTSWLVLAAVDGRGRRPLRPDAVYAAHLFQRGSQPPLEGQSMAGESGEPQTWQRVAAGERGGPDGDGSWAWAHGTLRAPRDGVLLVQLSGALTLFVNGDAYACDYYSYRNRSVPVAVRAGDNDVFVSAIRGRFRFVVSEPESALVPAPWGDQRPSLVPGTDGVGPLGVGLLNSSLSALAPLTLSVVGDGLLAPTSVTLPAGLSALEDARLTLPLAFAPGALVPDLPGEQHTLTLRISGPGVELVRELSLPIVDPHAARWVTRISPIDGSVQSHALLPPAPADGFVPEPGASVGPGVDAGLVLSLHGASVQGLAQARALSARPDLWMVAPTNRSPFGFDWQDWGRLDAYEALEHELAATGVDRSRVFLAGHSMGGHGSWHLAALDPDGFAAVAPSAGWVSFDSYGGRPDGALTQLWHAADVASNTLGLIDNLVQLPVFVVHGSADDNVPLSQAQTMIDALTAAGRPPQVHIQEGAGHWWNGDAAPGADCVDWPGTYELFRRSSVPAEVVETRFICADPGLDSRHHLIEVVQARRSGEPVTVQTVRDGDGLLVSAHNARRLVLHGGPRPVRVQEMDADGHPVGTPSASLNAVGPELQLFWDGAWIVAGPVPVGEKRPGRTGPFKRAFDGGFALVLGTAGSAEENAELLSRARTLAGEWTYRGGGRAPMLTDRQFLQSGHPGNVVLLGNADTNRAWDAVLDPLGPLRLSRGVARLGDEQLEGDDLACLAVLPRRDDDQRLVGIVGDTGPAGTRLHAVTSPFTSGVGMPDVLIFDSRVLSEGDGGVRAASFWDQRWMLPSAPP